MKWTLIIIIILTNPAFCQYLEVQLNIDDEPTLLGNALLVDATNHDSIIVQGNFKGTFEFKDLKPGSYELTIIPTPGVKRPPDTLLVFEKNDTLRLRINTTLCEYDYLIKSCPSHGSTRKVIRVNYSLRVMISWKNEKAYNRYAEKLQKQGYQSWENHGEEVLIYVHDESQNKLLEGTDVCDQYLFCTKHKLLFK